MESEIFQIRFVKKEKRLNRVCAEFEVRERLHSIYFFSDDVSLVARPEVLAVSGIIPAMRMGCELHLESALEPLFSAGLREVQSIYSEWFKSFHPVNIVEGQGGATILGGEGTRVGLFFSGGVDSFYTLLKHQDEITDLIFVHGFDIRLENRDICAQAEESIRRIGEQFGKRVIKVETNIRSMLDVYAHWERTHGAALAAVGHLLGDDFGKIYISASDSGKNLSPWGSHPKLDPLWSRSGLEFVHDGCNTTRTDKLKRVASSDLALRNLRVCWKNREGVLNCGRCEKCIRTMIGLEIIGALGRCPGFSEPLRLRRVLGIKIPHPGVATGALDNLRALQEMPEHRWLLWTLQFAFLRSRLREVRRAVFRVDC